MAHSCHGDNDQYNFAIAVAGRPGLRVSSAYTIFEAHMDGDPLELDPETMRRLAHLTVDWLVDRAA